MKCSSRWPLNLHSFQEFVAYENKEVVASRGVAILIHQDLKAKCILKNDFVVVCEVEWDNFKYYIGSVYLPSGANHSQRRNILESLKDELNEYQYIGYKRDVSALVKSGLLTKTFDLTFD